MKKKKQLHKTEIDTHITTLTVPFSAALFTSGMVILRSETVTDGKPSLLSGLVAGDSFHFRTKLRILSRVTPAYMHTVQTNHTTEK